jgi:hypothetical protein
VSKYLHFGHQNTWILLSKYLHFSGKISAIWCQNTYILAFDHFFGVKFMHHSIFGVFMFQHFTVLAKRIYLQAGVFISPLLLVGLDCAKYYYSGLFYTQLAVRQTFDKLFSKSKW